MNAEKNEKPNILAKKVQNIFNKSENYGSNPGPAITTYFGISLISFKGRTLRKSTYAALN
jgi:hypothetical protein